MPILYEGHLINPQQRITKMSMRKLTEYEALLWTWMGNGNCPVNIARELNAIHREVEYRAQDTDWRKAGRPRTLVSRSR